jgi:hypothetical protein
MPPMKTGRGGKEEKVQGPNRTRGPTCRTLQYLGLGNNISLLPSLHSTRHPGRAIRCNNLHIDNPVWWTDNYAARYQPDRLTVYDAADSTPVPRHVRLASPRLVMAPTEEFDDDT